MQASHYYELAEFKNNPVYPREGNALERHKKWTDQLTVPEKEREHFYGPVPFYPNYAQQKDTAFHGVREKEHFPLSHGADNPLVWLGLGATVIALAAIGRNSLTSNVAALNRSMQYRIAAQMFTVCTLVTGASVMRAIKGPEGEE
uniref:HIG1 domain-containing protein n=1 Tax=Acrobeloides nanus TaxID=290746 RepID=A0A914CFU1_9BILA